MTSRSGSDKCGWQRRKSGVGASKSKRVPIEREHRDGFMPPRGISMEHVLPITTGDVVGSVPTCPSWRRRVTHLELVSSSSPSRHRL